MVRLLRYRSFIACAALLVLSALWRIGGARDLSAQQAAAPETFDQAILSSFKWRSIGPDRGGRSIAVSGVKGQPKIAYFGAVGGGLWKTTDGGMKWAPITDGQIDSSSVGGLTPKETEVLRFLALGHTNAEIAALTGSSIRTIETHRAHIHQRLDRHTRAELVRFALDAGLLRLDEQTTHS